MEVERKLRKFIIMTIINATIMYENEIQKIDLDYESLHQESWAELLKEKLENLESDKIINKEVMKRIFYSMTNKELNIE
jgi:hypothetical protein